MTTQNTIRVMCSRCGSYIGSANTVPRATSIQLEHIAQCEVDP